MARRRRNFLLHFVWKAHIWLYRLSGGRLGTKLLKMPVLLLFTQGRKTGRLRVNALSYIKKGTGFVVVASNGGSPVHPDWWFNLQAQPSVTIQVGSEHIKADAKDVAGEERIALWQRFVEMERSYARYEKRTNRLIPLVHLKPRQQLET